MSIISAKELDYKVHALSHATYQLSKVVQQTGSQSVTVSTAGGQESIFELPPKVYNLSRSVLSFTATPPASGAGNYNWIYADGIPYIRQIQLYTRTGLFLCDINDVGNYTNMILRHESKLEDVETWDKAAGGSGYFEGLMPSNETAATNYRPTDAAGGKTAYLEPQYLIVGTANAATPAVTVKLNLDRLKNTLFSVNKDLYFAGEILYLRIVWNPSTKIYFYKNANYDPTAATVAGGNVTISNLQLYLAVEQDLTVENALKAKALSGEGLQVLTPFVYYNKQNLSSTSQNITLKYNRAHGIKLQKIYWAPYHNTESSNTAYDHDNKADAKVLEFYTMVDNVRTSQFNYDTSAGDDYMVKKDKLKGSAILSSDEYYYNWVWVEDFTDNYSFADCPESLPKENLIEGKDLSGEVKYDIFATTANASHNHYIYAVTQKMLTVSPAGIVLM